MFNHNENVYCVSLNTSLEITYFEQQIVELAKLIFSKKNHHNHKYYYYYQFSDICFCYNISK